MSPNEQIRWLELAIKNKWSKQELRRHLRDDRRAENFAKIGEAAALAGTYNVLYADPPWQYEHSISDSRDIEMLRNQLIAPHDSSEIEKLDRPC